MMRLVMESAGLTLWPVISLAVFSLFAAGLVAWLFRSGSRGFYRDMASLALDAGTGAGAGAEEGTGAAGRKAAEGNGTGGAHGRQG